MLAAWLAWWVYGPRRVAWPAAVSLTCLYSALFIYHRYYDLVILIVPMLFCLQRARDAAPRPRWPYTVCLLLMLAAISLPHGIMIGLNKHSSHVGLIGRLIDAFLLPAGTWVLLGVLALLGWMERPRTRERQPVAPGLGTA